MFSSQKFDTFVESIFIMNRDFVMLPIFYHTSDSNRNETMSSELGIEIEQRIEDYEVRLTRVNTDAISFYYPMNFLGVDVCGMSIDGAEVTLSITAEHADLLLGTTREKDTVVNKRSFWSKVITIATKLTTKLATKSVLKTVAAIMICSSMFSQGDCPATCVSSAGNHTAASGLVNELSAVNCGCLSAGEATSSYWLRINFTSNGVFMMTISPSGNKNDFDFAIWSTASCPPTVAPVRCSWAGISPFGGAANKLTGLAAGNVDVSETAAGNGWLAPMNVVNGQSIVININNYGNGSNDFATSYTGTTATMFCGVPLGDDPRIIVTSSLCGYDVSSSGGDYVEFSYNMLDFHKLDGDRLETSETPVFFRLMSVNQDGEIVVAAYAYCKLNCDVVIVSVTDLQGRAASLSDTGVKVVTYSDGSVKIVI